jgi:hypothetical protein
MTEKERNPELDQLTPKHPEVAEELEIVELDERLDMTIDPMIGMFNPPTNGNCNNTGCC